MAGALSRDNNVLGWYCEGRVVMAAASDSLGERVARIEGAYEHLATKADIERLKFQLFAGMFAATGIILAAMRLWM